MKLFLSLLAIITFFAGTFVFAQTESFSTIKNEIIEDAARPGVSPFQLSVTSSEREEDALRVRGTFKVYNEKETTSSEFGYVIYSGEMLGAKGIQRPALPEKLEGSFVLSQEEIREISFDVLLPEYFKEMHDGIELSLVNDRGYSFEPIQARVIHDEIQYPRGKIQVEGKSVILNKDQEYALNNGITLYTNEDVADINIVLGKTSAPIVVIPEIVYFERTYFSEPALTKKYSPIVTRTTEETVITLPVTLMNHGLLPTIYPFEVRLDIQAEGFADPVFFGRLTLGGASAKVLSVGFNNKKVSDVSSQERLDTIEIAADGALPDVVDDRRRQRSFDADVEIIFFDEGQIVYEDRRATQVLPMNEYVFVLDEKLRLADFDEVQVRIFSEGRILDTFTQTIDRRVISLGLLISIFFGVCVIGGLIIGLKRRKKLQQGKVAILALLVLSPFFASVNDAEAGARDYYDNRKGCERVQNQPPPAGGGGGQASGGASGGASGSGSGDGGGGGAWFVADDWINKWRYIEGFGETFGSGINSPGLSSEEVADLPDVMTVDHNLLSPAAGCYQPGEVVELNIGVSVAICSNSSAGANDDVDEVAVFQVTTETDWFIDYGGEYDPALVTEGNKTKPCPVGNDKTFGVLQRGNPSFDDMHNRKQGWTILSQGENTTQPGGGSINEVKTIYIQMPYEPGEYTLGTRLTIDPTKNGGITESKESIDIEVCDGPRDMCYLIEGLQYVDSTGVLRDASGNTDNAPSSSDPSIDEYVIQYVDHDKIVPGTFDNPTPSSFGPQNNFTLQSVCNLCPNPLRPTLPLNTFTNRKEEWRGVAKADLDAHESDLTLSDTGADGFPDDIDRDYSEVAYQSLRTDGGSFSVEEGDTQVNDAIIQHYDNGSQVKGNQSRMTKGVLWRNFFNVVPDIERLVTLQTEIDILGQAAALKKREAELVLDVIHLWTDAQGNEHYAEPFGEGLMKVYSGLVPNYHIDGGAPNNHAGNVPLYQDGANPLVPYDYNGHQHTHYIDNLRGIDDALRNIYTSPYDTSFYADGTTFRDFDLSIFNQNAEEKSLPTISYDIEYSFNEYEYPANAISLNGQDISSGNASYGVYSFDMFFTNQMKSALLQNWLQENYSEARFDGCYGGDCFDRNVGSQCAGGSCTSCNGASCSVTPFFVPFSYGSNSQVLAAHARTYDQYYANEPIQAGDNIAAYDFMKSTIWADLVSVRARLLGDIQDYKRRQVALLREFETLPPFFESAQPRKWPLVENYRLYREQIDLPHYNSANGYSLDTSYLSLISGIDSNSFTDNQIRVYQTYIKAYFNDSDLAMEYLVNRLDLNESTGNSQNTGLNDGDASDTHIIQLISGNDRTCIAFEDICTDDGIQSAFLKEGDAGTVELYDIDAVTAEKIDSDPGTPEIDPRKSLSLATANVTDICDQTDRPLCPNNAAWDYDATSNIVYEKNSDTTTGAAYDPTKDLCLTQCISPAPPSHAYDSTDVNDTTQAVYDTGDAGTVALADWYYNSTTTETCQEDSCPTVEGNQELVEGSNPAQAQDVGDPASDYYLATLSGGGYQCVNEACTGSPGVTYEGESVFWYDGTTIRTLGGEDTNFDYDSVNDTCTSTDVCENLVGNQEFPPEPPEATGTYQAATVDGNPNYCDYCAANLPGIQNATDDGRVLTYNTSSEAKTEEKGWYQLPSGSCTSVRCFTEPGDTELYKDLNTGVFNQVSDDTPTDFVLDGTGYCHLDVCENVSDSLQINNEGVVDVREVPDGYRDNGNGTCTEIDYCKNIPLVQGATPADYVWDSANDTCDFCAGQNGRPDVAGVQHVQDGNYNNPGAGPGVLSNASMYEYNSVGDWSLVTTRNTQTCELLICTNYSGGAGITDTGSDSDSNGYNEIEYNLNRTDLYQITGGSTCGCLDSAIPSEEDPSCYVCNQSTGYTQESTGVSGCPTPPPKSCQLSGGGTILIEFSQFNQEDGTTFVHSGDGFTYRITTSGSGKTCTETSTPTFKLTTTPGFIDVGDLCEVHLEAVNVDQCRITLLSSNFDTPNSCSTGNGDAGSMCFISEGVTTEGNPTTIVSFTQDLKMTDADGSVLVVAECAPDNSDIDGSLDGDYVLEAESECRITPNIGEF